MIPTWMIERAVVAAVLFLIAVPLGEGQFIDWISAIAVLLSFSHAQIADRLREADTARDVPTVLCSDKLDNYWMMKEVAWVFVFVIAWNPAALLGCFMLGSYPAWRRFWRKIHPKETS